MGKGRPRAALSDPMRSLRCRAKVLEISTRLQIPIVDLAKLISSSLDLRHAGLSPATVAIDFKPSNFRSSHEISGYFPCGMENRFSKERAAIYEAVADALTMVPLDVSAGGMSAVDRLIRKAKEAVNIAEPAIRQKCYRLLQSEIRFQRSARAEIVPKKHFDGKRTNFLNEVRATNKTLSQYFSGTTYHYVSLGARARLEKKRIQTYDALIVDGKEEDLELLLATQTPSMHREFLTIYLTFLKQNSARIITSTLSAHRDLILARIASLRSHWPGKLSRKDEKSIQLSAKTAMDLYDETWKTARALISNTQRISNRSLSSGEIAITERLFARSFGGKML